MLAGADVRDDAAAARHLVATEAHERDVDHRRRDPLTRSNHGVAAGHLVALDPREVQRDPTPGRGGAQVLSSRLDAPDAGGAATGLHEHLVGDGEAATRERAGHHGARTLHAERPIDPQSWPADVCRLRGVAQHGVEGAAELVEPAPGGRRGGDDRPALEAAPGEVVCELQAR